MIKLLPELTHPQWVRQAQILRRDHGLTLVVLRDKGSPSLDRVLVRVPMKLLHDTETFTLVRRSSFTLWCEKSNQHSLQTKGLEMKTSYWISLFSKRSKLPALEKKLWHQGCVVGSPRTEQ